MIRKFIVNNVFKGNVTNLCKSFIEKITFEKSEKRNICYLIFDEDELTYDEKSFLVGNMLHQKPYDTYQKMWASREIK